MIRIAPAQLFMVLFLFLSCAERETFQDINSIVADSPAISGKPAYLDSPFVTAGDRVYLVGHQNGSFPELGWHIKGEMGGIWNHPIKLMDGFDAIVKSAGTTVSLDNANSFTNYPYANSHNFALEELQLEVRRGQFVPDGQEGLLVQYVLNNKADTQRELEFEFIGYSDLRPTWLGDQSGMMDGADKAEYLETEGVWLMKDEKNPWFVAFGADGQASSQHAKPGRYVGTGAARSINYKVTIPPRGTEILNISIAGSYNTREAAIETQRNILHNWPQFLSGKKRRYEELASHSRLTVPDTALAQTFEWLKYNCDWLVRTVPEIGSGITAGIPDYPWWFGVDSEYALKGYMAIGQTEPVYETIALLDSVSNAVNGNGRILHEMSTNGVVFNKGNVNETPQFASLIWEVFLWNGDEQFLKKYFPAVKKGLDWLMAENDENGNLFPDGFGMMEIHGMDSEMIDVAAYTQRAFADAGRMAMHLGDTVLASQYRQLADTLSAKINDEFWSADFNSFADFIGTDRQALTLIDDAIVRADTLKKPWAVKELLNTKAAIKANPSPTPRPFVLHHNWVVNTPMEMQIADTAKAIKALETAENFVNPFGVFVTGIDRDETAGSDDGSFSGSKVFSYTGAVMTLPTGVQAVAENNYGRPDKALDYLKRMARSFSYALPGSMYEVSPDYGMMTQAWNIYSFAIPIVQQFFGIKPMAHKRTIMVKPQLPTEWHNASLEDVKVADNSISVYASEENGMRRIRIAQTEPGWRLNLELPIQAGRNYKLVKGTLGENNSWTHALFNTDGEEIIVEWNASNN